MNTRFIALVVISTVSCDTSPAIAEAIQITGPTMGTYYKVVIDSPPEGLDTDLLQDKIEAKLVKINQQMSTWDEASEISKFNQSDSTDWFEVSPQFAGVVVEAKRIFELSEGAFDPTVEPLIKLWGFGDRRRKEIPSDDAIADALKQTGMGNIEVRLEPPSLKKKVSGLQLNLSAIAKGYAVDAVAEVLKNDGLLSYVVDIGGENKAGKSKASGSPWKLGVESPVGGLQRVLRLTESSVATSGDYRNFFKMNGVTYSHTIDPTTGWPMKNPPASVSVICESCMTADAWATAMMVLGAKRGGEIATASRLSVMFQEVSDDDQIVETTFGAFAETEDAAVSAKTPGKDSASMPWFPFAAAAAIFLIAVAGMAIGTMVQNKSLKGSCGGLASMPGSEGKSICELCTIPRDQCTNTELREQMQAAEASSDPA